MYVDDKHSSKSALKKYLTLRKNNIYFELKKDDIKIEGCKSEFY